MLNICLAYPNYRFHDFPQRVRNPGRKKVLKKSWRKIKYRKHHRNWQVLWYWKYDERAKYFFCCAHPFSCLGWYCVCDHIAVDPVGYEESYFYAFWIWACRVSTMNLILSIVILKIVSDLPGLLSGKAHRISYAHGSRVDSISYSATYTVIILNIKQH